MAKSRSLVVRTIPRPSRAEILALSVQGLGTYVARVEGRTRHDIASWYAVSRAAEAQVRVQKRRESGGAGSVRCRRAARGGGGKQLGLDPEKVLFLDECEAKTNLVRTHGRASVGTRLVAKVPHGHGKSTTFVSALGRRGWDMNMPRVSAACTGTHAWHDGYCYVIGPQKFRAQDCPCRGNPGLCNVIPLRKKC